MRLKSLTIRGFRGFNAEQTLPLNQRLTLIYGPNSYGKTSISEALEWLLYGATSKVEHAHSKDEYKGSYRNRHYSESRAPSVKATLTDGLTDVEFAGELCAEDSIQRYVDGSEVASWPMGEQLGTAPKPFVVQHALKDLLLTAPGERFERFARFLGFQTLEELQKDIVSLCTKPSIPQAVQALLDKTGKLEQEIGREPSLDPVYRALRKGLPTVGAVNRVVSQEAVRRVPSGTPEALVLDGLRKIRRQAVEKVFSGKILVPNYMTADVQADSEDGKALQDSIGRAFLEKYLALVRLADIDSLRKTAELFRLGTDLLSANRNECPLCGQPLTQELARQVESRCGELERELAGFAPAEAQRREIVQALEEFGSRLKLSQARHEGKMLPLLGLRPALEELRRLLIPKHAQDFDAVATAISQLGQAFGEVAAGYAHTAKCLDSAKASVANNTQDPELVKSLGESLSSYLVSTRFLVDEASRMAPGLNEASATLAREVDALAGVRDVGLLLDLAEQGEAMAKRFRVESILQGLAELRKQTDLFVADTILESISGGLTSRVLGWYELIKTTGDPDVHFSGFDLERTAKGGIRARRVQIKATSYGRYLVSAVSSLSESKLNALGLCLSIAVNWNAESPFDFMIIDDPIQSMDQDHATAFVGVIQRLAESGRQLVLLSHNKGWVDSVREQCRSLNGSYYEITGYTMSGPCVSEQPWASHDERIREVDAILKDPTASSVRLQQAEGEIRILVGELTSALYLRRTGSHRSPHDLNALRVRGTLIECGVDAGVVSRISETFVNTDPAHHADPRYAPSRERIRRYLDTVHELRQLVRSAGV